MRTVYLAGAITGESYAGATSWRAWVQERLHPEVRGISPLRAKEYLANESRIAASYEDLPLSRARGIMTRDFFDVQNCDIVLANLLDTRTVSIGTVVEIAWAYALRTPVIAVLESHITNVHEHPMLHEAIGYRVDTLTAAVEIANAILADYASQAR